MTWIPAITDETAIATQIRAFTTANNPPTVGSRESSQAAKARIVGGKVKLKASRASWAVNGPRFLKMSRISRDGMNPKMPPKCARVAHCLSSDAVSGRAFAGTPSKADGG